ncbi:MAG: hypothetical protein IJX08_07710 [Clostridia bacterium]|nr:hypothetical protein [Clostridia bacterium]
MKKLLSLILIFSLCLSSCLVLSSCSSAKNPYQKYMFSHGSKTHQISEETAEYPLSEVASYYKIFGELSFSTSATFHIYVDETEIVPQSNDNNTQEYKTFVKLTMSYNARGNTLDVYVDTYSYSTNATKEEGASFYKWTDGYSFVSAKDANTTLQLKKFQFNIDNYFENGKLSAEDALQPLKLDTAYLTEDMEGLDMSAEVIGTETAKYTRRNPNWESDAIADIMVLVNKLLSEVDTAIAE